MELIWKDFPEEWDDDSKDASLKLEIPSFPLKNNLFIEGDNYPVLKKLEKNFSGKINLIYIDPPYNTGNAFTYNDKFNSKDDPHSVWLSFMFRRLSCAKNLLAEDGCIFIAIDQSELYTLKLLCDKIFNEANFVNDFMWLHGKGKKDQWSRTLQQHTLCYAKNKACLKPFSDTIQTQWATKNADNDPRGNWFSGSISFTEKRSNPNHKNYFTITSPSGIKWTRQWLCSKDEMDLLLKENKIWFGSAPEYSKVPRRKIFNDQTETIIPQNIIDCTESTKNASLHLEKLLGKKNIFDNPKPVSLVSHLIKITQLQKDSLILDFFAGSGTTFESVLSLNKEDGGKRKCILIQKKEIPRKDNPFKTISELCWQRLLKNSEDYEIPYPDRISLQE
ncbi:MAG: site-specific DNA-methyltransferase [Treponema sp.]|nr:site-specific DNA-methyltransferase [Treponema sp.]